MGCLIVGVLLDHMCSFVDSSNYISCNLWMGDLNLITPIYAYDQCVFLWFVARSRTI